MDSKKKKKRVIIPVRTRALREAERDLQKIYIDIAPFVKPRKEKIYKTEGTWTLSSNISSEPLADIER